MWNCHCWQQFAYRTKTTRLQPPSDFTHQLVYQIPCVEDQTWTWSVETKVTEHKADCRHERVGKSALDNHNRDTGHDLRFQDARLLTYEPRFQNGTESNRWTRKNGLYLKFGRHSDMVLVKDWSLCLLLRHSLIIVFLIILIGNCLGYLFEHLIVVFYDFYLLLVFLVVYILRFKKIILMKFEKGYCNVPDTLFFSLKIFIIFFSYRIKVY